MIWNSGRKVFVWNLQEFKFKLLVKLSQLEITSLWLRKLVSGGVYSIFSTTVYTTKARERKKNNKKISNTRLMFDFQKFLKGWDEMAEKVKLKIKYLLRDLKTTTGSWAESFEEWINIWNLIASSVLSIPSHFVDLCCFSVPINLQSIKFVKYCVSVVKSTLSRLELALIDWIAEYGNLILLSAKQCTDASRNCTRDRWKKWILNFN